MIRTMLRLKNILISPRTLEGSDTLIANKRTALVSISSPLGINHIHKIFKAIKNIVDLILFLLS